MTPASDPLSAITARACAAAGLDAAQIATLRAFAQALPAREFERAFARCFEKRRLTTPEPEEATFLAALLERECWGDAAWFAALVEAWDGCRLTRRDPALLATACACLADATAEVLAGDSPGRAQRDIVRAVTYLGQALHATIDLVDGERRLPLSPGSDSTDAPGLPGREHLLRDLADALAARSDKALGLVLLQLDARPAAYALGDAGPERLRWRVIQAIREVMRAQDGLYAISPLEWAVLLPDLVSSAQVQLAARRLVERCEHLTDDGLPWLRGAVHAGTVFAPDDADAPAGIEHAARAALRSAMRSGATCAHFRPHLLGELEHERALERDMAMSVGHPPFMVWLQPQVHLASGRCAAAEALLRWQRDDGQWVAPPQIIATAIRLGLMPGISRWLIAQVARMIRELSDAGLPIPVSLNLVAGDLHDEDLPALVAQTLAIWKVAPDRLTLEITEGALIADRARAARIIAELRSLGVGVSLDDFGTGFSSFAYLRDLPVNEVKIDRLFVSDLLESPRDRAIVSAVLALARGFGLTVVAEGVEDARTEAALRSLGCEQAQGFLYAPAMPLADFIAWLSEDGHRPAAPTA